jgi:hypothetical protein
MQIVNVIYIYIYIYFFFFFLNPNALFFYSLIHMCIHCLVHFSPQCDCSCRKNRVSVANPHESCHRLEKERLRVFRDRERERGRDEREEQNVEDRILVSFIQLLLVLFFFFFCEPNHISFLKFQKIQHYFKNKIPLFCISKLYYLPTRY